MDTFQNWRIKKRKTEIREKKEISDRLIEDRKIRYFTALFEQQEKDYYTSKKVHNFWNNNYIVYRSYGDRNNLSLVKYLNKIERYLRNIITDLQNSDT